MNPKLKSESYQNFGGINNKVSANDLNILEFMDIKNFDFQTPGALTQRWGSTQYAAQTFPGQVNSLFEFGRLDGASYVVASYSGGVFFGATTGNYQGVSLASTGITFPWYGATANAVLGTLKVIQFGSTGVAIGSQGVGYKNNPNLFILNPITNFHSPELQGPNYGDMLAFQNWMFYADGKKFLKFNGSTFYPVGLPIPTASASGGGATVHNAASSATVGFGGVTTGLAYGVYASYVNNRGFESQIALMGFIDATRYGVAGLGGSFMRFSLDVMTPLEYGISTINVYSFCTGMSILTATDSINVSLWNPNYIYLGSYAASGTTVTTVSFGTSIGNFYNMINNIGSIPDPAITARSALGLTLLKTAASLDAFIAESDIVSFNPQYIDIFQNRIFASGFSSAPSDVYFSELGEPEGYQLVNNFQVRTNDADVIVGQKDFINKMMFFKRNSVHALFGDSPSNFFLQELTTIYGALNNRCIVNFDNNLVFLDRKGVIHFNGSSFDSITDMKVQPYFDRMNYNVAINTAIMQHDKLRSQIMIAIPIDGATQNNITVVYDYLVKAWTTHTGYVPTSFATIQGYNNTKNLFYGSASGTIQWQGPSFCADNGVGFTASFKTRFLHDMGESIEKQFRRLYINAAPQSSTLVMPINFYQDYGTSIVLGTTFVMSSFQDRLEFGIPAKALAFELFNLQTSSPLKIPGFTIESRLQRRV